MNVLFVISFYYQSSLRTLKCDILIANISLKVKKKSVENWKILMTWSKGIQKTKIILIFFFWLPVVYVYLQFTFTCSLRLPAVYVNLHFTFTCSLRLPAVYVYLQLTFTCSLRLLAVYVYLQFTSQVFVRCINFLFNELFVASIYLNARFYIFIQKCFEFWSCNQIKLRFS